MATINPYIHFNGNAEEAFGFYQSVLGGSISGVSRYRDIASDAFPIGSEDADRIMHIELPLCDAARLMGSDTLSVMGKVNESDNRNTIFLSAGSVEEADFLFAGLSANGTIEMPISHGPFGNYFGMCADKYGVQWMVDFNAKKIS